MTVEARLGRCSACEDLIEETRKVDIDLRRADARDAEAEADRMERRLTQSPPRLDDPRPPGPNLRVEMADAKPTP